MNIPKKIHEEIIYKDDYVQLMKKTFEHNGVEAVFAGWGYHKSGAMAMILTKDKKVVYTREYRTFQEEYFVHFAAGGIDEWETPEEAAFREAKEEIGLVSGKILPLGYMSDAGNMINKWNTFLIYDAEVSDTNMLEEFEELEVQISSLEEFEGLILDNVVCSPYAIAMFLKAKLITDNFTNFPWK